MAFRSLLMVFLFLSAVAYGEDWKVIPTNAPDIVFSIDLSSVERQGNLVSFREKLRFDNVERIDPVSGKGIREKRSHRIMDCKDRSQGLLAGSMFDDEGHLIEMVNIEQDQVEMTSIPARTIAEQELAIVCALTPGAAAPDVSKP